MFDKVLSENSDLFFVNIFKDNYSKNVFNQACWLKEKKLVNFINQSSWMRVSFSSTGPQKNLQSLNGVFTWSDVVCSDRFSAL